MTHDAIRKLVHLWAMGVFDHLNKLGKVFEHPNVYKLLGEIGPPLSPIFNLREVKRNQIDEN